MQYWDSISTAIAIAVVVILLGLAFVIFFKIWTDRINITMIVSEPDGKASLSRFQFLLFTFVIAGLYLLLCIESGTFVDIPESVLGLLGISGGSYVLSKSIGASGASSASRTSARKPEDTQI